MTDLNSADIDRDIPANRNGSSKSIDGRPGCA
jgi:hypothetical protein